MQNEEKKTISKDTIAQADAVTDSSSPTRSYSPARDVKPSSQSARSPAESSVSSDLSHRTSLSHGSSPGEEKRPASPPGTVPAKPPSTQPVVNRSVWDEPVAVTKVDPGVGDGFFGRVLHFEKRMQNEEKKTISKDTIAQADAVTDSSSPTRSYSPARDVKPSSQSARSPAESSVSSDLSHRTSLSHGSSPGEEKRPASPPGTDPAKPPSTQPVVNRSVWDEPVTVTKVDPGVGDGSFGRVVEGGGGGGRRMWQSLSILRRPKREAMVKKAALGFRVCGFVFCLISFSVMAADKNKGWAIDSFYQYKEFRYCMTVNVIGFVYSVAQAYDLAYHLSTGKYFVRHQLRYYVDFSIDQMLTYLLMSASSSAATRVEDWQSNWGKDKFPEMASVSVGLSFMAFVALAASSLISGYALCIFRST